MNKQPKVKREKTIFRVAKNPENPFVMIDKRPLENKKISWKAKGVLAYLLSRPDNWEVQLGDLLKRSPDGSYAVRHAIKELVVAGHMKKRIDRDERQKFIRFVWEVYEVPFGENRDMGGEPFRGFPQVGNPQVGNRALNNTESNNTKRTNIEEHGTKVPLRSLEWELAHGAEITQDMIDAESEKRMLDAANLIATGLGTSSRDGFNIAYSFQRIRNIVFTESQIKGQRKAIRELLEAHITEEHVNAAVHILLSKNFPVVDLFSVIRTARDVANPRPKKNQSDPLEKYAKEIGAI